MCLWIFQKVLVARGGRRTKAGVSLFWPSSTASGKECFNCLQLHLSLSLRSWLVCMDGLRPTLSGVFAFTPSCGDLCRITFHSKNKSSQSKATLQNIGTWLNRFTHHFYEVECCEGGKKKDRAIENCSGCEKMIEMKENLICGLISALVKESKRWWFASQCLCSRHTKQHGRKTAIEHLCLEESRNIFPAWRQPPISNTCNKSIVTWMSN